MKNEFQDTEDTIDFKRLFSLLWRWNWLFLLFAILSAGSAFAFSRWQTPVYQATTNILVSRNTQQEVGDISQTLNITQIVETYARMLTMDEFVSDVSQKMNYVVTPDQINVRSLPNTQIIELSVQDTDPVRAARIADAMVVVLAEKNEELQSGRYKEAEEALETQIKSIEDKIAEVQGELGQAGREELALQISQVQADINATSEKVNTLTLEIDRLQNELTWQGARFKLRRAQSDLSFQQSLLNQYTAERDRLEGLLESDRAKTDQNYAGYVRERVEYYETWIETTQQLIEELSQEIIFLTPLESKEGFANTLLQKQKELATEQALLKSYQESYARLLSTEEVTTVTDEMENLQNSLNLYQEVYVNLLGQREEIKKERLQNTPNVEQVSPALAGSDPVKPRTMLNTLLGGLAGLLLAGAFIVVRESADDTVKSREDVKDILGVPVLGYLIEIEDEQDGAGIYTARFPRSPVAEAFRSLRTHLGFTKSESPIKRIIVTSTGPSEGKTTVAANLAAVLAHSGRKVILVDTDMRRPRIHQYLGVPNQNGLSGLEGFESVSRMLDHIQPVEKVPGLYVLPSGGIAENPADLISSDRMGELMNLLNEKYDHIVMDAPPMLVSDPHFLLGLADGVLLVMIPGKTLQSALRSVQEVIQKTGVIVLGAVFNRLKRGRKAGYGYEYYEFPYYYTSEYYYSENPETGKRERKKQKQGEDEKRVS